MQFRALVLRHRDHENRAKCRIGAAPEKRFTKEKQLISTNLCQCLTV